jgi:diguanylate cyclase (GGDEF)-like protein
MAAAVQESPAQRKSLRNLRASDQARVDARAGVVLLLIYLIDAALLAGFCLQGLISWAIPLLYVTIGVVVVGGFALAVALAGRTRLTESNAVLVQTIVALLLTLGVAWTNVRAALLMLLTVVVILPTAALRLSPRRVLILSVVAALGCLAVVDRHGGELSVPMATGAQRLLTGVFFLWTLVKGASVNLAGIAMRLELNESHSKLADALARVEELAESDELTGLANRRHILATLAEVREQQIRSGFPYAVAMLDVDHFKRINDTFGHALGDEVLRRIASLMRKAARGDDKVGRIGGEEFLLVLPGTSTIAAAKSLAERLRSIMEQHEWEGLKPGLHVTASIGLALGKDGEAAERVLARADEGMYEAKRTGRNRVAHVSTDDHQPASHGVRP